MSQQLLYDVDERICAIKNSLKQFTENFETTPSSRKSAAEKLEFPSTPKSPKSLKSPKSHKKLHKPAYVSNYVAFGGEDDSDSSIEEKITSKRVKFDPASSTWYDKSLDQRVDLTEGQVEVQEILGISKDLVNEKNKFEEEIAEKNQEIDGKNQEIDEKNQEIFQLKEANFKFFEMLNEKDKEKEGFLEMIGNLKSEVLDLNKHIERYQSLVKELEDMKAVYAENDLKNEAFAKFQIKIEELTKENTEILQSAQAKDAELHYLQTSIRELTRHNSKLEKIIEKSLKDKPKPPNPDKKLKSEIKQLILTNEALKEELKRKPAESQIKETEKKLADLEKMVNDFCKKKILKSDTQHRKVIGNLLSILKISKSSEILNKVQDLLKPQSSISKKIRNLIVKYSPPGSFSTFPSDKKVYLWIKRLIEEYLLKIKEHAYYMDNYDLMQVVMKRLSITFPEDLLGKVESLLTKV